MSSGVTFTTDKIKITVNEEGLHIGSKLVLNFGQLLGINEYNIQRHIDADGNNEYRLTLRDCILRRDEYIVGYFYSIRKAHIIIDAIDSSQEQFVKRMANERAAV